MAYLTKDQVKEIISKAPQGTSPEGIVSALRLQGNQLEGFDTAPPISNEPKPSNSFIDNVRGFATGLGASLINTAKGIGDLVGLKPTPFGEKFLASANNTDQGTAKDIGKFAGDVAQIAIPVGKVGALTKSLPKIVQYGAKALTSAGVVSAQEGKIGTGTGIAAGTELLAPVAGAVLRPVTRLVKSLASGLSGVPSNAIESIVAEGSVSKDIANQVDSRGTADIIKKNAETIINGVSKVRQDARQAYGTAVQELKATDINPQTFREAIGSALNQFGSVISNGVRKLTNIEFDNPTLLKKANAFINKLSTTPLDGLSLNRLQNEIDASAFKTTGSDPQRLSFNAFLHDLSGSIRTAINQSTDKLKEINKAYSTDMQLSDAVENIFGSVKFKNLEEVLNVSKKLEGLFSQKGIAPKIVDDFLTKIGVKPSEFRASEAVRQISDVHEKANPVGLNMSEVIRGVTSSVVTPKIVRDLSIFTGLGKEILSPMLDHLSPVARASFVRLLLEGRNK